MEIFLTGGTGKLGKEVLRLIPSAVPLVRRAAGLRNEAVVDFSSPQSLKKALAGCGALIHLAGSMKFHDPRALREGNVTMTKNLLAALPKNALVVFASSVSVYGKSLAGAVDEKTPPRPDSPYSRTKYEAEKMVMEGKNSVALRIGPIYGPQYEDYPKFLKLIRMGRMAILGSGKNPVSFVHVEDVAQAVKNALRARPGIYVVAGPSETQERIYEIAAKGMGVPAPKIRIPVGIALALAGMEEKIALLTGKKPLLTREHVSILAKPRVFDFSKAEKGLKFRPRPLEKGIMEIINADF